VLPANAYAEADDNDDDDDANSVASSASSVSSLASELAGPSTSKAGKKHKGGRKQKAGKKQKVDKRRTKKAGIPRIICFASNFGLSLLRKAETWSSDGTFAVCPEPFYQFYTVFAHLGHNSYPAAYIFMPGKKRIHYHVCISDIFGMQPAAF
jgi:hypothetical protein